jgi:hypothetical protein
MGVSAFPSASHAIGRDLSPRRRETENAGGLDGPRRVGCDCHLWLLAIDDYEAADGYRRVRYAALSLTLSKACRVCAAGTGAAGAAGIILVGGIPGTPYLFQS